MKYNTIEIEERRARNEALIAAAANEGKWQWDEHVYGHESWPNSRWSTKPTSPNQAPAQNTGQTASKNFYIEVDGKYVLVTKDEDGNIVPVN